MSSVSLLFRERLVHVVFCCLQILLILGVRTLQVKQLDCLIHHCDPCEVLVDVVHVDWDIELIQRHKSSLYSTVIVSHCLETICSSSDVSDE